MNSLFLLIVAVVAFVFGYRFYSKLLASAVFQPSPDYSIAAKTATDSGSGATSNPYFLMGQHFGLVVTAATVSGAALAVYWGWVPAFLWVIVGSTLAAGIYAIGSLWLCRCHPDESLLDIVGRYFPGAFRDAALLLILIVLLLVSALLLSIAASLFVDYPSAVLAFLVYLLLSVALGTFLRHRPAITIAPATGTALIVLLSFMWPLGNIAVGFSGAFNFDFAGNSLITLDASLAWIIALSAFLYFTQQKPLGRSLDSRAWLSAVLFTVMLAVFFAGVAIDHPQIVAPGFNASAREVSALPWLLVTITGGAIAGLYLLIAHDHTARRLARDTDARVVGYGTVVLEGLAAVSAIIICSAGFASLAEWKEFYFSWTGRLDPSYILQLYINGFSYFASFLGLNTEYSTHFAALSLVAVCIATLEVTIGLLNRVSIEAIGRIGLESRRNDRRRLVTILLLISVIAAVSTASEAPAIVMLFGISNQLLVALGLLLLVLALEQRQLPGQLPLGLVLLLVPTVLWVIGLQLGLWWKQGSPGLVLLGLLLFVIGGWILLQTGQILWKPGGRRGNA